MWQMWRKTVRAQRQVNRTTNRRRLRLEVETLEDRLVMSSTTPALLSIPTLGDPKTQTSTTNAAASPAIMDLGTVTSAVNLTGQTMNSTWERYRFQLTGPGSSASNIAINFQNTQGNLDIYLCDSSEHYVGLQTMTATGKSISLNGKPAGTYYILVNSTVGVTFQPFVVNINPGASPNPNPDPNPNPNPNPGNDWFAQNLQDPNLQALVRTRTDDDGVLSRNDMLAVFTEVAQDGVVTSAEYADLQTIIQNAGTLNMPEYVQVLADKVVNGDPANGTYQGSPLGNLAAGSSGNQLNLLVNKWFLGLDHPAAQSDTGATTFGYQYANGSLFVSGISYTDINQGDVGDCYFLAGLAETALRSPGTIQSMFTDNGDGTFTVRFVHNGVNDYVTVDRYLPVDSFGRFAYANMGQYASSASNELWVALAEKAYVEENQEGWLGHTAANSYQAIAGGDPSLAAQHITGLTASYLNVTSGSFTTVVNAWNAGQMISFGSLDNPSGALDSNGVVPDHAYALVGYNASTQQFTLFNPWGINNGSAPGMLTLTWNQIRQSFFGTYLNALGTTGEVVATTTVETSDVVDSIDPAPTTPSHASVGEPAILSDVALFEMKKDLFQGNTWASAVQTIFAETDVATADLMGKTVDPLAPVSDAGRLVLSETAAANDAWTQGLSQALNTGLDEAV
jgi:hypothetical protein